LCEKLYIFDSAPHLIEETNDDNDCSHDNDSKEKMQDDSNEDGYNEYNGYNEYGEYKTLKIIYKTGIQVCIKLLYNFLIS
jgi:hypothetical protein